MFGKYIRGIENIPQVKTFAHVQYQNLTATSQEITVQLLSLEGSGPTISKRNKQSWCRGRTKIISR